MTKSTATQLANLDRDHDGHPGGSLPKDKGASAPSAPTTASPAIVGGQAEADPPPPVHEPAPNDARLGVPVILVNPDGTRNERGQNEFAAIITRVNADEGTVCLTAFLPNRGPALHVNIRHQSTARPSDRFHWRHIMEPALDGLAKSGQP